MRTVQKSASIGPWMMIVIVAAIWAFFRQVWTTVLVFQRPDCPPVDYASYYARWQSDLYEWGLLILTSAILLVLVDWAVRLWFGKKIEYFVTTVYLLLIVVLFHTLWLHVDLYHGFIRLPIPCES